jgi:tRNA-(ms[2]io[6]A)-hydroxylase
MESEARHYTTFLHFAKKYGDGIEVELSWIDFLKFEADLMLDYGKSQTIHG